ncbi:hypothetical protein TSAR_002637 [Trichomalopsis sarcophagae]|uniref:Uncharacterized protein n=1 Tax=Trichomalopsis sarcophagae TaxID=543379 RepID=A0A232EKB5_9HYME|nr:hypothetical protein TSAR_002637 [Trichomalopsis sarcophagae]
MSRANQRAPMRGSLSAQTGSQSEANKKRGPDDHERKVSARTSGKSASSLPTVDGARRRLREFRAILLCLSTRGRRLQEIGRVSQECARVRECVTGAARWH